MYKLHSVRPKPPAPIKPKRVETSKCLESCCNEKVDKTSYYYPYCSSDCLDWDTLKSGVKHDTK